MENPFFWSNAINIIVRQALITEERALSIMISFNLFVRAHIKLLGVRKFDQNRELLRTVFSKL